MNQLRSQHRQVEPQLPRRRQGRAAHRRRAQGHRRGAVRRRPAAFRACCTPRCCAARIRTRASCRIDTSAAAAMPGVKAVATGADTAKRKWGAFRPDLYPLAIGKVRYVGDEVAAVAADGSRDRARRGRPDRRAVRSAARRALARRRRSPPARRWCTTTRRATSRTSSLRARRRRRGLQGVRRRRRGHLGIRAPVAHGARDHRLRRELGRTVASRCGATRRRRFSRAAATRPRWACRKRRCA